MKQTTVIPKRTGIACSDRLTMYLSNSYARVCERATSPGLVALSVET